MLFCKQSFLKNFLLYLLYKYFILYLQRVTSVKGGSITKNLSMKECKEDPKLSFCFANFYRVKMYAMTTESLGSFNNRYCVSY